jgi:hypothetical protein
MYVVAPFLFSSYILTIYMLVYGNLINCEISLQLKFAGVRVN